MKNGTDLRLGDDIISQVAKLLQIALLTGTDVVDNLRQLRLSSDGELLSLSQDYKDSFGTNLQKMIAEAEVLNADG
tara:strand:+ start:675 stop:902 length:228 start_codon:yes stop_codon:yes gene_type:complete